MPIDEPLERVGGGPGLERTAAQEGRPGGLRHLRCRQRLLRRLHRTRTGDEREAVRSDRHQLVAAHPYGGAFGVVLRSEEHTSELPSLMRLSYAVFCLKKNNHD